MVVAAPSSAGNRFRQRKISTKQTLQIFKQSQVSDIDNEDLQQRDIQEIETGVDKNEEDEVHLQKILKKTGLANSSDAYIPTPDASKVWEEATKYYTGNFVQPDSYIKSSCQVEDYAGCLYNMDEEDDEFLTDYNKKLSEEEKTALTEDEFEILFEWFEKTITEKQPFLITDPYQILSFEEVKLALLNDDDSASTENVKSSLSEDLNVHPFITLFDAKLPEKTRSLKKLVETYGEEVYKHFKKRKIARQGKTVTPSLKFTGEDDSDAYICFRQRQFRQQRKTRRADTQSSEKLLKLYQELKATKELAFLVAQREVKRLEAIQTEREIFELRCKVKTLKRDLGITDSDEDLVAHKKKKVIPPPEPKVEDLKKDRKALSKIGNNANIPERTKGSGDNASGSDSPQQFQPYVKLPPSKIPDMELETVQRLLNNKDASMQKFVEEKMKKRKILDIGFTNLTDDINSPYFNVAIQNQEILDPSHTPYSSITSSFYNIQSYGYIPNMDKYTQRGTGSRDADAIVFNSKSKTVSKKYIPEKYSPFTSKSVHTSEPVLTLRKRIGRLGQVYIDRKNMIRRFDNGDKSGVNDSNDNDADDDDDVEMQDSKERFEDRWKFDTDISPFDEESEPFSDDPSKLNSISNETQVIRFGSMLVSKAYETLKEAVLQQRQQQYYQHMQRAQSQQKHQKQQQALQAGQGQGQGQTPGPNQTQGQSQNPVSQNGSPAPSSLSTNSNGSRHVPPVNNHTPIPQGRSAHGSPVPNGLTKVNSAIKTEN